MRVCHHHVGRVSYRNKHVRTQRPKREQFSSQKEQVTFCIETFFGTFQFHNSRKGSGVRMHTPNVHPQANIYIEHIRSAHAGLCMRVCDYAHFKPSQPLILCNANSHRGKAIACLSSVIFTEILVKYFTSQGLKIRNAN
jgi:hypothetical protein